MKHFLALFALAAHNTYWKVLAATAAVSAAETGIFFFYLQVRGTEIPLDDFWGNILFMIVPTLGAISVGGLLVSAYRSKDKSRPAYSIGRLPSPPTQIVLANGAYHAVCYLFYAAVQILLFWGFTRYYTHLQGEDPAAVHTSFLVFLHTDFLCMLLPFAGWWGYLRNLILFWCTGTLTSVISLADKGSSKMWYPLYLVIYYVPFLLFGSTGDILNKVPWFSVAVSVFMVLITLFYLRYIQKGGLFLEEDAEETVS